VRWFGPIGGHRRPAIVFGLLAAAIAAVLTVGGWTSTAALTVLVAAGALMLVLSLTPVAWLSAALAVLVLLLRPGGVIAGLILFLGSVLVFPRARLRVVAAVAGALVLAAGVALQVTHPHPDGFYAAPAKLPEGHGVLVRSEVFDRNVPSGAHAWRILYSTTRGDGTATVATAIVVAGTQAPPGPRPVVVWAHGATGIAPGCAPSLGADPVGTGSIPDIAPAVAAGWVVIAPDYPGLGTRGPHPFLIGQGEARSLLDAVLAARGLDLTLSDRTVVWGHSQGGNAALWAGIIAPAYAPATGVVAIAALAPGTELPDLAAHWGTEIYAAYLIEAYSETYSDVRFDDYVRAAARIPAKEQAGRCLDDPKIFLSGLSALRGGSPIWAEPPDTGPFGDRLRENVPDRPISVPVLVDQGEDDTTVPARLQDAYVRQECATGTRLEYRRIPGRDHVGVLGEDLMQWSRDRLDGKPAASTC
jgi:pimeloyl-ACP methyl ester carboxylesterase